MPGARRHRLFFLIGALGLLPPGTARAQDTADTDAICIRNATSDTLYFVAEATGGARMADTVAPGGILCAGGRHPVTGPGTGRGTVAAFADIDAIEGCSRLAEPGKTQVLIEYQDFDRCRWSDR